MYITFPETDGCDLDLVAPGKAKTHFNFIALAFLLFISELALRVLCLS